MKFVYITLAILLLAGPPLSAQQTDSVSTAISNRNYAADSAAKYMYNLAEKYDYLASTIIPVNYNTITVGHHISSGDLIPSQSATRIQDSYLTTAGSALLGDVSLWGLFSYHKIREDSTRWAQQSRNNPTAAYYYGSPAFISYSRSIYHFKGTAERNMIRDNLPISVGIDYRIGDHYATNDPRGAVSDYQFNLFASAGYKLTERLKAGIVGRYGYGQERVSVGYKREEYFQSSVYPDYINYQVTGYGRIEPKNKDRNYRNDQKRYGFDAYLILSTPALGQIIANASLIEEKQKFRYVASGSPLIIPFNDYDLSKITGDIAWNKRFGNTNFLVAVNYLNTEGNDFAYAGIMANTYFYNRNDTRLKIAMSKEGRIKFNYQLGLSRTSEERQDGLNANKVVYDNLILDGGAGFLVQNKSQSWGLNLSGVYSMPTNDVFIVPTSNEQLFTRGVIYHDYLLYTSSYAGGGLDLSYSFSGYKQIQTGIRTSINYTHILDRNTIDRNLISIPGDDRLSVNLSLNLYF